ncbi:DUF1217 domain-containing protein [Mesorhizobium sp. M3A.F.Ca.ET.174.01.1.1]|nr:DUF1217 domain-containing protein [Mesorhizobium sp. M3A.F.Ca.ET.080.04.2.1]PBB86668.1 flagellar biosynthesis protein FlgF [Mesorhizobium sp. WSM3876]RWB72800.1 MAG: DUF1217 domain-containing protein [Mesorhizobium sp.]TGS63136.1 DUF1217 domain-containing protein [Mesorhizobium sp. M3A.F.Ca.ET.201.01.1.1]TGS85473.1 DUF1217 domain-containing protein [Mesorhizobium sp. M3A.F.Ca.ET.175.01.1.1]TGT26090.1 DUF1217 domain-containing protein [Mesorhizobium sp. M3A.F.Ca.ET.174.01.1.1]TGT56718.1 DUF
MNTYTSYQLIAKDIPKAIDQVESQPAVKRETEYYLANIGNAKTIDDFVGNTRLFNYAMKAFGLEDMAYAKAFMVKALKEGVSDEDSFANKLTDKRYAEFVKAFNFAAHGETATIYTSAQQGTVDKYMRQTLEENAGETNQGVRLALYFQRKAPTITNWYDVLADTALSSVVRTALGLPDSFASADIDKQAQLFEQKLDIADFKDTDKLSKFLTRFTSLWEINNPTSTAQTSVGVLFAQPTTVGISTDLMMAMQKLKF